MSATSPVDAHARVEFVMCGNHYRLLNVVCWSREYGLHDTVLAAAVGTDPVPERPHRVTGLWR